MNMTRLQIGRLLSRMAFFALFVLAPPLDIFRFDLYQNHFILFGMDWTLGLDAFQQGEISETEAAFNLIARGFIPLALVAGALLYTAWRWGRLYCGWLCPHFSVVETINSLMRRSSGKPTLWEKNPLPAEQADGSVQQAQRWIWLPTMSAILLFSFVWAVSLMTYLLPPEVIYGNLFSGELTRNQFTFIAVATLLFFIEFTFARHLFCRFGCALGLFQSLAWMSNDKAMVVGFDRRQASTCKSCNNACDNGCPMRLKPRTIKRKMFTCTECGECIAACTKVQQQQGKQTLLRWVHDECAKPVVSGRDDDKSCF